MNGRSVCTVSTLHKRGKVNTLIVISVIRSKNVKYLGDLCVIFVMKIKVKIITIMQ